MTGSILMWIKSIRDKYQWSSGRVLEVGSLDVNGNPRSLFSDCHTYTGVDLSSGPNVDLVCDAENLSEVLNNSSHDTIICCEMLEHAKNPIKIIVDLKKILVPGGRLIITSPTNGFPLHRFPRDYWRIMPDVYEDIFFQGCDLLELKMIEDAQSGNITCAFGIKKNILVL